MDCCLRQHSFRTGLPPQTSLSDDGRRVVEGHIVLATTLTSLESGTYLEKTGLVILLEDVIADCDIAACMHCVVSDTCALSDSENESCARYLYL